MRKTRLMLLVLLIVLSGCMQPQPAVKVSETPQASSSAAVPAAPPFVAVPQALCALAQKDNCTAAEQISLSMRRIDEGLELPDVPPYGKETVVRMLLALDLQPAEQGQAQTLPVSYPVELIFNEGQTGIQTTYELTVQGVQVNGLPCITQNPAALSGEEYLSIDFLHKRLLTLGEAMGLSAQDAAAIEWVPASPPSDQPPVTLEGEKAVKAAEELFAMILRPREATDNPSTGGSDTFRITLRNSAVRSVTNWGFVSLNDTADPEYFSVRFYVPEAFSS